jgi:putative hemolysin
MGRFHLMTGPHAAAPALELRAAVFRGGRADGDAFDAAATALAVTDRGATVAACRLTVTHDLAASYAGQFHDLSALATLGLPGLEVGRLCAAPGTAAGAAPDVLRALWAGITAEGVRAGVQFLFGVTSLRGADPDRHAGALAALAARRGGPAVQTRAPDAVPIRAAAPADPAALPAVLRAYLAMGAFVAGDAVPDRDLNTLHILTVLPVAAIPPARLTALSRLAVDLSAAAP